MSKKVTFSNVVLIHELTEYFVEMKTYRQYSTFKKYDDFRFKQQIILFEKNHSYIFNEKFRKKIFLQRFIINKDEENKSTGNDLQEASE